MSRNKLCTSYIAKLGSVQPFLCYIHQGETTLNFELAFNTKAKEELSALIIYRLFALGAHASRLLSQQTDMEPAPDVPNQVMFISQGPMRFPEP